MELALSSPPAPIPEPLAAVDWDFADSRRREFTHSLHPWPARFVPDIPATAIALFTEPGDLVVDPFVGCGTTALEARCAGRAYDVSDANELAVLITRAKCDPPGPGERAILARWVAGLRTADPDGDLLAAVPPIPNRAYWFSDEAACQLAHLLREIRALGVSTPFVEAVFSSIVTSVSFQESETRYRHVDREVSAERVLDRFRQQLVRALRLAATMDRVPATPGSVAARDARTPADGAQDAQLAVFSPPYPNAFDYHLYHRFRMFWLGFDPVLAKHAEIGAHLRSSADEHEWLRDMAASFEALATRMADGAHVVCVVGDGLIRGRIVPSADLLWDLVPSLGFQQHHRTLRAIPTRRKSFKASDGRLRGEDVLIFRCG